MNTNRLILFIVSIHAIYSGLTQPFPSSPYTYFGVGDIISKGFGQQLMVGSTGIADRNPLSINNLNPASYSSISYPFTFIAETGFNLSLTIRETESDTDFYPAFQLPYLSIAFKTGDLSGASLGLRQFSSIDYNIFGEGEFTGLQEDYNVNYIGEGGINEIYFGWSKNWTPQFSAGLSGSFLFGQINENQLVLPAGGVSQLSIEDEQFVNGFRLELGAQYWTPIGNSTLSFGLTLSPAADLNEQRDLMIINTFTNQIPDTLVEESVDELADYAIPLGFGFGSTWIGKKLKISADYTTQLWSDVNLASPEFETKDSHRFSFGIQNIPDYSGDTFWKRMNWGVGSYVDLTYMTVDSDPLNTVGLTAGFGYPVGKNKGIIRFIIENASRGETTNSFFRENMTRFTLSLSILESWFRKSAYD